MVRTITVTSGKGGVGKTSIGVNLALQLARKSVRTCLFDADLGLANVNILLGLSAEGNLSQVIDGQRPLTDIVIRNHHGIDIIPGSSGVEKMANLLPAQVAPLVQAFAGLEEYEVLLFDTSSGISRSVVAFCLASSEVVLVITPEPTSLTDAYGLIKVLCMNGYTGVISVVVNQCRTAAVARETHSKLSDVVRAYLAIDLPLLGFVRRDPKVAEAVASQEAFTILHPDCDASRCIDAMVDELLDRTPAPDTLGNTQEFWSRFLEFMNSPMTLRGKREPRQAVAQLLPTRATEGSAADADSQTDDDDRTIRAQLADLRNEMRELSERIATSGSAIEPQMRKESKRMLSPIVGDAGGRTEMADLVRDAAAFVSQGALAKWDVDASVDLYPVAGDSARLRQIIGNMFFDLARAALVDARLRVIAENLDLDADNGLFLDAGTYGRVTVEVDAIDVDRLELQGLSRAIARNVTKRADVDPMVCYSLEGGVTGCVLVQSGPRTGARCHLIYRAKVTDEISVGAVMPSATPVVSDNAGVGERFARRRRDVVSRVLREFQYEVRQEREGDEVVEYYFIARPDASPIKCAFHGRSQQVAASGQPAETTNRVARP